MTSQSEPSSLEEAVRRLQLDVALLKPTVARADAALFGTNAGMVIVLAKMQQQMKLLLWVAGTLGSGTLLTLVGIFFKLATAP